MRNRLPTQRQVRCAPQRAAPGVRGGRADHLGGAGGNGRRIGTDAGVAACLPDGTAFDVLADTVIVAAGATETPGLLRRSAIGGHPRLGRNLALHPATVLAGRFDDDVVAWRGVLQSAAVHEFHEIRTAC